VNESAKAMEVTIELSDSVKDLLVAEGYDPNLGARPLRRAVQRFIEDPLSEELLLGRFQKGDAIVAETEDGKTVIFKRKEPETGTEPEKELVGQ
ncbi:ATP-dependent Clp protease ATP-binding subunit ClpC, partial [bacterium]